MRSFAGFAAAKFCAKKKGGPSDLSSTASRITSFLGDLPRLPLLLLHSQQHQASSSHRRCYSQAAVLKEDTAEAEAEAAPNTSPSPSPREVLWAIPRVDSGSIISGKERKAGRVPSVVFDQENGHLGGNKQLISVNTKQISRILKQIGVSFFLSRLYDLEIHSQAEDGEVLSKVVVLPRLLHLHAGTDEILNVTFIRAPSHAKLRVDVPLLYLGEDACPGIRKGGWLNTIRRTVKYLCPPEFVPPFLEVDLSNLQVGQKVLIKDLAVHSACRPLMDVTWPVCKIMGSRALEDDTATKSAK